MPQHNRDLSLNQQGKDVALLHGRLINIGYTIDTSEIINEFFGQSTHQAVIHFQQAEGLEATGVVESATAQAIVARAESDETFIVPKPSIPPHAATSAPIGPGEMPGEPSEMVSESIPPPEEERQRASSTQEALDVGEQVQKEREFTTPGEGNGATDSAKGQVSDEVIYTVVGTVSSPDSAGVGGLSVQVVDKNVGPDILLRKTTTDQRGRYRVSFSASRLLKQGKEPPDLQARVYVGETFLAASEVRYNASTNETLDVKLPANSAALPSEYETLTTTLTAYYKGRLGDRQETSDRQDVTYLANKTGWDARAVALAALADQFSKSQATATKGTAADGIKPEFYYALFRAGLPANAETLYLADPQAAGAVWKQAIAQGVIPQALANEIPAAIQAFQALSAARALDAKHPVGLSTLKELLQLTLGEDTQRQQQFADLYVRYQNDLPAFWSHMEQSFGPEATKRLQLDGQLGYLTLNNAPLIERLHNAEQQTPLTSTLDLAQRVYYQAAKWEPLLDGAIPAHILGSTPDEQRANYAELLAAQVRLAFPTAVFDNPEGGYMRPMTTSTVGILDSSEVLLWC
jgi:Putative peptidoglycan binding domain